MNSAIIIFPGTNRERDMAVALTRGTGQPPAMLWHRETTLPDGLDLVVLPGGFSHGDYLRTGAMAARSPIMPAVAAHAARGGYVLGVCNGFQILTEAGLLPGALLRNAGLRFISRDCTLRCERTDTAFTHGWAQGATFKAPMAHGDGNYFADDDTIARLEDNRQVAFRYVGANLNGSRNAIAGVLSDNLRVLGLMPHPENIVDAVTGGSEGLPLFVGLGSKEEFFFEKKNQKTFVS